MQNSGEPGSLVGMGTCGAATRPHPTTNQLATAKRHPSAQAASRHRHGENTQLHPPALSSDLLIPSRATEAVTSATRQWLTCAAILAGSIIAQLGRSHLGHRSDRQLHTGPRRAHRPAPHPQTARADRAIDLIAEGYETLPIATVQRHRNA
jgi:hypothetical protein